jgi:muconate cycloisomerase
MKIAEIQVYPLRLPFRETFYIGKKVASDPKGGGHHIYVRVRTEEGQDGWGEARPSHRWSYETPETVVTTLRHYFAPALVGAEIGSLDALHRRMDEEIAPGPFTGQPIARSAIDMAVHDLLSRRAGMSLCRFLGGGDPQPQSLAYLVTGSDTSEYVEKVKAAQSLGYRGYKVKIGKSPAKDAEILEELRRLVGDAALWADANAAYSGVEARDLVRRIRNIGVEVLEQPMAAEDWEGLARLSAWSDVPIALDESLYTPRSILQYLSRGPLHALVLKLSRCGGVHPCFVSGLIAREAGAVLMGSGLTDSRLGLAASSHVFQALGVDLPVDLNGPQFIAEGPVEGSFSVENGQALLPDGPGLGFQPTEDDVLPYVDPGWNRL